MRRSIALGLTVIAVFGAGIPAALAKRSVDLTRLPVGATSTAPQKGRLWSCQTSFASDQGAFAPGPWFNGDGTWNRATKVRVSGSLSWPSADLKITVSGANRIITGNALPKKSTTGTFPVASTDAAYTYDRNPNTIRAQTVSISLPASPKLSSAASCVGGEVGISLDGPPIFSSIDAGGRDAQAYEVQDSCSGHPQERGVYHYHGLSACSDRTAQLGWALDGFPIIGPTDRTTGQEITNDDLDECHGRTATITIGGRKVKTYHYVANDEYPYTVGCFRGTATVRQVVSGSGGAQRTQPVGGGRTGQPARSTQPGRG